MESICNFLEKLFSTKEQEKVKPTPKIQSTYYNGKRTYPKNERRNKL